jgi:gas vesicle protein
MVKRKNKEESDHIIKLSFDEIKELISLPSFKFQKYVSPLLNLANRYSQATRPKTVGQLSELIKQWKKETKEHSIESWKKWYSERYPNAIKNAVDKMKRMIETFKESMKSIDENIIKDWVEDLIYYKTFAGLYFQEAILKELARRTNLKYRTATPEEESKGIDGYIGDIPISIKPETYKIERNLVEVIRVPIIYYKKEKDGITFDISEVIEALKSRKTSKTLF